MNEDFELDLREHTRCNAWYPGMRDCFNAGYQFPQYCRDNGIEKPLFLAVSEDQKEFLWEIYVQFRYDDYNTKAKFAFYNVELNAGINFTHLGTIVGIPLAKFANLNLKDFDKIIILTSSRNNPRNGKFIYFETLVFDFLTRTYYEIPLQHFIQKNPGVKVVATSIPGINRKYADFAKTLLRGHQLIAQVESDEKIPPIFERHGYNRDEVLRILRFSYPKAHINADGSISLEDDDDPLINIKNGHRATAYQPTSYRNKIYFFGPCHFLGLNAPFDKTVESYLQKMLNDNNLPYCVENHGHAQFSRKQSLFYNMDKLSFKPGDIVIFYSDMVTKNIPYLNLRNIFESCDERDIWVFQSHINEVGYKLIANKIFDYLTATNFMQDISIVPPPEYTASLWYTAGEYYRRDKIFAEQGTGRLQSKVA